MPRPPAPDDDAALRWDDLDDPSYSDPSIAALQPDASDDASTASGADSAGADAPLAPHATARRSAARTLLTAVFALVYLAYSVGWIISIGLVPLSGPTLVIEILYQFSEFLAIVASALWFAATVALTRGDAAPRDRQAALRFGWLALGTLLLLPWPIVLGVLA